MKWILIISLAGQGAGLTTAEFNTHAACETAAQAYVKYFDGWKDAKALCVEKGQ